MKKLLILIIFIPFLTYGQKWRVQVGAGLTFMTLPRNAEAFHKFFSDDLSTKAYLSLAGYLSGERQLGSSNFALGLRLGVASLKRRTNKYSGLNYKDAPLVMCVGLPAFFLQPSVSYSLNNFYAGIQAGIISTFQRTHVIRRNDEHYYMGSAFTGFAGGIHAGYRLKIVSQVGAFAELSCNYIDANQNYAFQRDHINFFQPQGTLGVWYSFK